MHLKKWDLRNLQIGARAVKTSLSIVAAIYVSTWLGYDATLSAIGTIFVMQPTVYRTFLSLLQQIVANLFGAAIAIILVLSLRTHPILVGIGSLLTIWFAKISRSRHHIGIALVTMIIIMEVPDDNFIQFSIERIISILIGIILSFLINAFIFPPRYEDKLYTNIKGYHHNTIELLQHILQTKKCRNLTQQRFGELKKKQMFVEQLYLLYKDERKFYKKREMAKTRKLVVYRAFITSVDQAKNVIIKFQSVENNLHKFPDDFREKIFKQIDILSLEHVEIVNHFQTKRKHQKIFNKTHLTELLQLLGELKNMQTKHRHIILKTNTLISSLFEYGKSIEHLQSLLNSQNNIH